MKGGVVAFHESMKVVKLIYSQSGDILKTLQNRLAFIQMVVKNEGGTSGMLLTAGDRDLFNNYQSFLLKNIAKNKDVNTNKPIPLAQKATNIKEKKARVNMSIKKKFIPASGDVIYDSTKDETVATGLTDKQIEALYAQIERGGNTAIDENGDYYEIKEISVW
jgi:hypothetical protein